MDKTRMKAEYRYDGPALAGKFGTDGKLHLMRKALAGRKVHVYVLTEE